MELFILLFLIGNMIFWSFFSHQSHCEFLNNINSFLGLQIECPSHTIHLLMGFIFYLMALYYSQYDYINRLSTMER